MKNNNQRYYLHSKIRKQGYTLKSRSRTIFVPYHQEELSNEVTKLRDKYGYSIQTEIV